MFKATPVALSLPVPVPVPPKGARRGQEGGKKEAGGGYKS